MKASDLHVFTARSNPLGWRRPHEHYLAFADHMLASGVNLHVVECAYGDEEFACKVPGVDHIGVRAKTRGWSKENLLNIGIRRTPEASLIAWVDADIAFRRKDWAAATASALQHYDVVQPWSTAYDLGPDGQHMAVHSSFAHQLFNGAPVVPRGPGFWQADGGPYAYPHSGYAWAMTRAAYDAVGGLFDVGGMGSGDHHMALALVGRAEMSMPGGTSPSYVRHVMRWQERALRHVNGNIGCVPGTIEHSFHGRKSERGYQSRWDMFVEHQFDPDEDLKVNHNGVYEFATNKPLLRRAFDRYLQSRNEDGNAA